MKEGVLPVRDVARRLGVSVATLYRHIGKRGPSPASPEGHV
jgi:predicted DNA-binding transcriptional regulator AlpA